ncbi:dihydrolipoyllysine-residue succinyltransferase component of 2-oxoglutarate dehydrogenase complex 1 [Cucumis melo var. makuwa]|uniref:Dihydrolipoyllysine-residue succinyltransferase component of 2-oxoglutarate dehydrogenase complex 1 n=1 Tax=Cucumis melo var. makuwa TaxID=1194695 RepID=A0A5D3CJC5_CUCMM|nr:dihydrolipoyllysine-residue succinyltransferase component of 2-oxoglutarate dehydrogenase complex 1 [Cucumis melo var. makuwa]
MIAEDLSKQVVLPPPKFIALLFRTDSSSLYFLIHSLAVNVAYNHRVLVIDGKERVLVSKFIHYPQSILEKSKDGSWDLLDVVVSPLAKSITDGTLAKFLKNPDDRVELNEAFAQIEIVIVFQSGQWDEQHYYVDYKTNCVLVNGAISSFDSFVNLIHTEIQVITDVTNPNLLLRKEIWWNQVPRLLLFENEEGVTHVAPSEKTSGQASHQAAPTEKIEKLRAKTMVSEKLKAPSPPPPKRSATEP